MILSLFTCQRQETDMMGSEKEARAADRQERLRSLAYSDAHRPEIALFGLGDWILKSWTSARKIVLASEQPYYARNTSILDQFNLAELVSAVQNVSHKPRSMNSKLMHFWTDTLAAAISDFVCLTRFTDCIPHIHPRPSICVPKSHLHHQDGVPRNISYVRIHSQHEIKT